MFLPAPDHLTATENQSHLDGFTVLCNRSGCTLALSVGRVLTLSMGCSLAVCGSPVNSHRTDTRPIKPRTRVEPTVRPSFLTSDLTFHVPLSSARSTFQAFPHPNAFRRKFGTRSQALYHGTSSAHGSLYPPSIATSPSVASSAPSTYTSVKIRTAGTGHSTSSTGSRWTRTSHVESRLSGFITRFIRHMMMATCSKS